MDDKANLRWWHYIVFALLLMVIGYVIVSCSNLFAPTARAVADLLRPTGGPDALDSKAAIRRQLAACRGECGDGPPTWEEWSR